MPYGALTGDLYQMSAGNKGNEQYGTVVTGRIKRPETSESDDSKKESPSMMPDEGVQPAENVPVSDHSREGEADGQKARPQSVSLMQRDIDTVNNLFALWFGNDYRMSPEEQQTFERMVSAAADPVDAAGRYVSSLAISKRSGLSVQEVYSNLDAISDYFVGERYRPNEATFGELVTASFKTLDSSDLKGEWMRIVRSRGLDDPEARALEQRIIAMDAEIAAMGGGIPKNGWNKLKNDVLGSLGYTADVASKSLLASVSTAAVTGKMVGATPLGGLAMTNPITGAVLGTSIAVWSGLAGAVAGFKRSQQLSEADMYWSLMHQTDSEGNQIAGNSDAAAVFAGLYGNVVGFMETMLDGITSRASTALSGSVSRRFGLGNLTTKVLTDRGVQGTLENIAYAGLDWLAGGLDEGFLQEAPQQLADTVLTAGYLKTIGMDPDLSAKEIAADFFRTGLESTLVGLVYGAAGIPGTMRNNRSLALELRREAFRTPSAEIYFEKTESKRPDDMPKAEWDRIRSDLHNNASAQRQAYFGDREGTVRASEELAVAEMYDTIDPETGEETGIIPDGSIYRTPDNNALYTETREENGRTRVYAGDRNTGAVYGYAEVSSDGDTLTVGSVRVRPGYEGIREELVREAISSQRTGESSIVWEPDTEGNLSVRDALIRNNPMGREAGLDYGADFSINQDHDIQSLAGNIREALPAVTKEESVVAARMYSIADFDGALSKLNNGQPFQKRISLDSRYRGAADAAKAIIYAGKNADFSTFYHELFHVNAANRPVEARGLSNAIRSSMQDDASKANLRKFIGESSPIWGGDADVDAVMANLESIPADSDASQWTRAQFEDLARLAEAYATADNSKRSTLPEAIRNILRKIAEFMKKVYQTIKHTVPLPKEITDAYDAIMYKTRASVSAEAGNRIQYQNSNIIRQPLKENTYESAIELATEAHPQFVEIVEDIRQLTNAESEDVSVRKTFKGKKRSTEKAADDYQGDFSQILDYDGAMIQFDSILDAENAWGSVKKKYKDRIVKEKHLVTKMGYQDFKINLRMDNGAIAEIQFLDKNTHAVKSGIGHKLYEIYCTLDILNSEHPELTELQAAIAKWSREEYSAKDVDDYANSEARRNAVSSVMRQALSSALSRYHILSDLLKGRSITDFLSSEGISLETGEAVAESILNGISLISTNSNSTSSSIQSINEHENGVNGLLFQTAWHGSSHSFDRFSTDHIGTGEGNQSFGWGLYFSTEEDIGRNYAQVAVNRRKPLDSWGRRINTDLSSGLAFINAKVGIPSEALTDIESFFNSFYWKNDPTPRFTDKASLETSMDEYEGFKHAFVLPGFSEKSIRQVEEGNASADKRKAIVSNVLDKLTDDDVKQLSERLFPKNRNLYAVEISDGAYIEWYEPVPKDDIDRIVSQAEEEGLDGIVSIIETMDPATRESIFTKTINGIDPFSSSSNNSGERLYRNLGYALGSDKAASEFLNRAGFIGIRYPVATLHGGSRNSYEGGANYVIFNAGDIQITDHLMYQDAKVPDTSDFSEEEKEKRKKMEDAEKAYQDGKLEEESSYKQRRLEIKGKIADKRVVNKKDGRTVFIKGTSIDKMLSDKAVAKSVRNGFTKEEHYLAAENIEVLVEDSVLVDSSPDKNGSPDLISVNRYETPIHFDKSGRDGYAYITVFESDLHKKGIYNRIYSLEIKNKSSAANDGGSDNRQTPRPKNSSVITLPSETDAVNYQDSIDDFYDGFESGIESIETPEEAEKVARIYSEWAVEVDKAAENAEASLIDEEAFPYWDDDGVNLLPDGSVAGSEAEYEMAVNSTMIPVAVEEAGLEAAQAGAGQTEGIPYEREEASVRRPGISYDDAFDYEMSWHEFTERNKPDITYEGTDAEKDDQFVRAIQDDDTLLRYLGIIGEALYLNTRELNEDWHFHDQLQRERIKARVFDSIVNTSVRNASLTALKAELRTSELSPRIKSLIRREMADNVRFYRNILSFMLADENMKPEELVKEARGLDIPSRDVLDAMPIDELRALAETAEDRAVVDSIERGTLKFEGDVDEAREAELNTVLSSLAERIRSQETELRQNETTIRDLEERLDSLASSLSERDRNIDSVINTLRSIEAAMSEGDRALTGERLESYALTPRMKAIASELTWLSNGRYEEIEARHLKGRSGKYEIPKARRAAREEYLSSLASYYPSLFEANGSSLGKLSSIQDIYSPSGFEKVREVIAKRRDELRAEWKDEASAYAARFANAAWALARKLSADIDGVIDQMNSLQRQIDKQKRLKDRVKTNRDRQIFNARTEERWKAAKSALEAEKNHNQEIRDMKSFMSWTKKEHQQELSAVISKAKDDAALLADWMKAKTEKQIAELKKEQKEKRRQRRLYQQIQEEKKKLARSISRPVNLKTTDYETAAEAIMAIQAIVDPHFRTDWLYSIESNLEGTPGGETMTIPEAVAYLEGLPENDRNGILSVLSPDLAARLTGNRNPLNDWSVEQLRQLAEQVESLRRRGREVLQAKRAFEREIRERIQKAIIEAVREAGKRSGRDSGDTLPGSNDRVRQAQGILAKLRSGKYVTMRMQELAQLLDGGLGHRGAAYSLLVDEKRYHQSREWRAVDARMAKIAPLLTKEAINNLFDNVPIQFRDGWVQEYTVDKLAYIYLSQFDEDSRAAVAYGNLLADPEKGTLMNKGRLDENGRFIPQAMSEGTIIDDDQLKALGDARYKLALDIAKKELETRNLMLLVEAIKEDFSDAENFHRLNRASIEAYNTPLKRVQSYLPIIRQDLRGNDFHNDMADALFNLNTGDFSAAINKGMTISRISISPRHQRGVNLSLLEVWQSSVRNQEHLIEFAQYAKKLRGVFGNNAAEMIYTIDKTYSPALMTEIKGYIDYVINPYAGRPKTNLDKTFRNLRGRTGAAYLGWKMPGIVLQFVTSAWPFLQEISPAALLKGYLKLGMERGDAFRMIYEKSPMMKHRTMNTVVQEALERRGDVNRSKIGRKIDTFNEVGQLGLTWVDKTLVAGGWLGAYETALQQNLDAGMDTALADAAAAKTADDVVLRTQPTGDITELPSMFRNSSELVKIFLQFQSSLSVIWNNMIWDNIGFARNKQFGKLISSVVSYGMAGLALGLIANGFDDDDDAKDRALKIGYWFMTQGVESFPVFGSDISMILQRAMTGEKDYYGNGTDMFPGITKIFSGIEDIVASDKPFLEGVKDIAYGMGIFTGAPVSGWRNLRKVVQEGPAALLGR